jgi:hypothetical protein
MSREITVTVARLDLELAGRLRALPDTGQQRDAALERQHELLVRIARGQVTRRSPRPQMTGPELDDLACQAAAAALLAITGKLAQLHGESRFTTWAYKFVSFEVSARIGQRFWHQPALPLDAEDWDRWPGRLDTGGPDEPHHRPRRRFSLLPAAGWAIHAAVLAARPPQRSGRARTRPRVALA